MIVTIDMIEIKINKTKNEIGKTYVYDMYCIPIHTEDENQRLQK